MVTGEGEDSLAVEGSELKGSRGEVEAWYNDESRGEATGKSAVQLQQKTPVFGRCQYHELANKNSSSHGVKPARAYKTSCVYCRGWSQRSGPSPLE